jgi:hypothetical protein
MVLLPGDGAARVLAVRVVCRPTIERLIDHALAQRILARRPRVESLFADTVS